jgi:RNA polymerase-binding transcription factor DksA
VTSGRADLSSVELGTLCDRLLEVAERARRDRASLTADFDAIVAASAQSNADDEHDPEGSTIAFERAQVSSLIDRARAAESELAQALARWDVGTYGYCEVCDAPIGYERLLARPATTGCILHA